jgi:hypothetical protein
VGFGYFEEGFIDCEFIAMNDVVNFHYSGIEISPEYVKEVKNSPALNRVTNELGNNISMDLSCKELFSGIK